jgi:acyl-CoA reductase-like NAD-dependent aldehyde dehydrogenase
VFLAIGRLEAQTRGVERALGANLVGDHWAPAREGGTFEVRARTVPFESMGCWPRSGAGDARAALEAAEGAASSWAALGRAERVERLTALADRLETAELEAGLAHALGLEAEELRPRHQEELFRLRETLEILREGADGAGPGVFQAHWSDFVGGLASRLAVRLVAGHTAVVLGSPRLPCAAQALAEAVRAIELPPGVVSVLHDDKGEALRGALEHPELVWARLRATDAALTALGGRLGGLSPDWSVWPLRSAVRGIPLEADPAQEAASVVLEGFGRSSTLSGQLPGQVGRVVCHQRLFSRFSEELLQCLEAAPDAQRPVPDIDGDLPEHVRRAWALGLDEGATPIFGGEPLSRPAASPDSIKGSRPPRVVPPVVFTNVEPGPGLATLGRPAPVLSLIRGASDEAVKELVAQLEGPLRISLNEASQA